MLKVIRINILVLLGILTLIEIFFQINCYLKILPERSSPWRVTKALDAKTKAALLDKFGPSILGPLPEKYRVIENPALKKYTFNDVDSEIPFQRLRYDEKINKSFQVQRKLEGVDDLFVYDVTYKTTSTGLRAVENVKTNTPAEKFVVAAGCSFTFGEGLTQGQDYPSILQEELGPKWRIYNFGELGAGPNNILFNFETTPQIYQNVLKEDQGVFIWVYIDNHIIRALCPLSCYNNPKYTFIKRHPHYELVDGKFVGGKAFESFIFRNLLFSFLSFSKTLRFFNFDIPEPFTTSHYRFFFKMLEEMISRIEKENKKITSRLLVISYSVDDIQNLKAIADEFNFQIIDFQLILALRPDLKTNIPLDGHPTGESNWLLSQAIKTYLNN
jgi:hypothetical protein